MIPRYRSEAMELIWSDEGKFRLWTMVEKTYLQVVKPDIDWQFLDLNHVRPEKVRQIESRVHHEFEAFLRALVELHANRPELARWVHWGLTSSDVIDTANAIRMSSSNTMILTELNKLLNSIRDTALHFEHEETTQLGRTHGQAAIPKRAANRWRDFLMAGIRWQQRLSNESENLRLADLSGPVGDHLPPATTSVAAKVVSSLNLNWSRFSTQIIFRDTVSHWAATLAGLATWCEAIATEIRLLTISEIREVTEGSHAAQIGSSAMPHKENPIRSENACSLARVIRGLASMVSQSQVQWFDRDLAHSAAERVAVPDLCHVTHHLLRSMTYLVRNLEWRPWQMEINAAESKTLFGTDSHERLTELVRTGTNRLTAYAQTLRDIDTEEPRTV